MAGQAEDSQAQEVDGNGNIIIIKNVIFLKKENIEIKLKQFLNFSKVRK